MPYVRLYNGVNQTDAARTAAVHDINAVVFLIQDLQLIIFHELESRNRHNKFHSSPDRDDEFFDSYAKPSVLVQKFAL